MISDYDEVAEIYDELMQFIPYRKWDEYITNLFYQHNGNGDYVLDLGGGTAILSVLLSKHLFYVYCIDKSFAMLKQAQKREGSLKNVFLINSDILNFSVKRKFDWAISIYDTVNHLEDIEFLQFVKNVNRLLKKNGIFMFDFNTEEGLKVFASDSIMRRGANFETIWNAEYDEKTKRCELNITMYNNKKKMVFTEKAMNAEFIRMVLENNGFDNITIYEFLKYNEIKDTSQRGMVVCTKI